MVQCFKKVAKVCLNCVELEDWPFSRHRWFHTAGAVWAVLISQLFAMSAVLEPAGFKGVGGAMKAFACAWNCRLDSSMGAAGGMEMLFSRTER